MPVYFIRAGEGGPVKIGYAVNVQKRVAFLQTANPERLHILRVIAGDRTTEAEAHAAFAQHRLNGEWFTFAAEMMAYGQEASGVAVVEPRTRIGFHPFVEALIRVEQYSVNTIKKWQRRGVPYRVCNSALWRAQDEDPNVKYVDIEEIRRPIRRVAA